jgi:hypothetical protein
MRPEVGDLVGLNLLKVSLMHLDCKMYSIFLVTDKAEIFTFCASEIKVYMYLAF